MHSSSERKLLLLAVALISLCAETAFGQPYPSRPVRLVVPLSPVVAPTHWRVWWHSTCPKHSVATYWWRTGRVPAALSARNPWRKQRPTATRC